MKKTLLITSILAFALVLSGCKKQTAETPAPLQDQTEAQQLSEAQEVANAMQNGQPLTCTITDKNTSQVMNYSVLGKQFRMDGLSSTENNPNEEVHVISTGDFFYSWSTPSNQGVKMANPDEEALKEQAAQLGSVPDFSNEETIKEYENDYTMNCQPGTFDADIFTPPADVQFQDMSAMMENVMKSTQQGMTEEQKMQMEEMMKQYGN